MFRNAVHIISFPGRLESASENRLQLLAKYFIAHKKKAKGSLVIFQSAEVPGDIERFFLNPLKNSGVECSFATTFRTDWSMEELAFTNRRQVIAAEGQEALANIKLFCDLMELEYVALSNVREAEIYENARKSLQYTVSAFINQLALAYADVDIRSVAQTLLSEVRTRDIHPSIGPVSYKSTIAVQQLIDGSKHPDRLSLVRDAQLDNISSILNYAEIIKRKSAGTVGILGVSEKGDQKDVRLSPSLILAEKLSNEGITVKVHDPYFTQEEIEGLLADAVYLNTSGNPSCDCLILMTAHRFYRSMNQADINRITQSVVLLIDNPGIWRHFSFSPETIYHIPGDGKLMDLER
jgi:UDP-N-acetyl-D-mannosaminuronate dehydrogenase